MLNFQLGLVNKYWTGWGKFESSSSAQFQWDCFLLLSCLVTLSIYFATALVNRNNNCDAARALHTDVRPSHKKLVDRETAKDVTMSPINMRTVVFKIMLFAYKIRRALRQWDEKIEIRKSPDILQMQKPIREFVFAFYSQTCLEWQKDKSKLL